jgi:serine phosphatase RsbU (regulator of sigma subunit)
VAIDENSDDVAPSSAAGEAFEWAAYNRPCLGERVSGDVAIAVAMEDRLLVVLIDVLGHGVEAHGLATEMGDYVNERPVAVPSTMIENLHKAFKGSRGAAVGCAVLDARSHGVVFAGVGNPSFRILSSSQSMTLPVSDGIVGREIRTPRDHSAQLQAKALLVGCSDGVAEKFQVADYPQIFSHGVQSVVRSVVRRFGKDYDDATCLVVRRPKS